MRARHHPFPKAVEAELRAQVVAVVEPAEAVQEEERGVAPVVVAAIE